MNADRPSTLRRCASWVTHLRVFALLLIVGASSGCLLLDDDLRRLPGEYCSFDIIEAHRCEGYKSNYEVRGMCSGVPGYLNGIYFFEGEMSWNADNGKVAERYTIEPIPIGPHDLDAGEFHFTATCNGEPYQFGSKASCFEASYTTTVKKIPAPLWSLVQDAKPIAVGQFTEADLADFPLETDCKPADPAKPAFHSKRKRVSGSAPGCEPERVPALFITSPQPNQKFDVLAQSSLTLALENTRLPEELVDIEWQKLDGRFTPLQGLPTQVTVNEFPLVIALTDARNSAGTGTYRVRVRPHDEDCDRAWSFWQEFQTKNGGPALNVQKRGAGR